MIKPLLLAGLALLILGSATAAHARGDSRDDRNSSGRGRCETRSRHAGSRYDGRSNRGGSRYGNSRYGGARYGSSDRARYEDRGRWDNDRDDYRSRDRDDYRADARDFERDDDRDLRNRTSDRDDDFLDLNVAPARPRYELAPQSGRTPSNIRRTPVTGVSRRPAS